MIGREVATTPCTHTHTVLRAACIVWSPFGNVTFVKNEENDDGAALSTSDARSLLLSLSLSHSLALCVILPPSSPLFNPPATPWQ